MAFSRLKFLLHDVIHHVWHWSKLFTPRLWQQLAKWKQLSTDADNHKHRDRWRRVLWGILLPPLLLHGADIVLRNGSSDIPKPTLLGLMITSPRNIISVAAANGGTESTHTSRATVSAIAMAATTTTTASAYWAINTYNLYKATEVWRRVLVLLLRDVLWKWRSKTTPDARTLFTNLQQQGRVKSTLHYDLYLPSTSSSSSSAATSTTSPRGEKSYANNDRAILLLPGAGVGHRAYVCAAHRLSDVYGYTVVVPSAEPTRHVTPALGYDARTLQRTCLEPVMRRMDRQHRQQQQEQQQQQQARNHNDTTKPITEWILVGHSMGAFATTHVVRDLQATMMTDHGVRLNKIVMWGVAPYVSAMKDLSSSTKTTTTPQPPICVAVIQGQDDAIIDWMHDTLGKGLSDQFWAKLPSTAREFTLPSGTHSGFAHYDPSMFPENNTDRLRQQIRTVQLTHEFITGSSPP